MVVEPWSECSSYVFYPVLLPLDKMAHAGGRNKWKPFHEGEYQGLELGWLGSADNEWL